MKRFLQANGRWIFFVSVIGIISSITLGNYACQESGIDDVTSSECFENSSLESIYGFSCVGFLVSGFFVRWKDLFSSMKDLFSPLKSSNYLRQVGWFTLTLVTILYPYHVITNPECYDDDYDDCESGTLDSNLSVAGIVLIVFSLAILGFTGGQSEFGEDDPIDMRWLAIIASAAVLWGLYWISSLFSESLMGEAVMTNFGENPIVCSILIVCVMTISILGYTQFDWLRPNSRIKLLRDTNETANEEFIRKPCSKCGKEILSNHVISKTAKVATYTPIGTWVGMTIGMAFGGFPGLFLGGLMGGAGGIGKGLEEKAVCFDCKYE